MSSMKEVESLMERQGIPASVHTERVVLGAMLSERASLMEALEKATDRCFSLDSHKRVFAAMRTLADRGNAADFVTVADVLAQRKELETVGGRAFLISLTEDLPRGLAITNYVEVLKRKAIERDTLALLTSTARAIYDSTDASDLLQGLIREAQLIEQGTQRTAYRSMAEISVEVAKDLIEQRDRPAGLLGITTGLASLDEFTTGFRRGELTYIGAAPGCGKTSFLLQSVFQAAQSGIKVGVISLEMRATQLVRRLLLLATDRLKSWHLRDAKRMSASEFSSALLAAERSADLPIHVCDADGLNAAEVSSIARRMVLNDGVQILYVDFVQIVQEAGRTQKEAVDKVSAALRSIAKTLNIPVVCASQLARRDGDVNRVPQLHDLRESGNLEQDAHCVIFLYRPRDKSTSEFTGDDQVIVAKQREGGVGAIPAYYDQNKLMYRDR